MGTVTLAIPPQHPAFAGHFPGAPIVPGALLLDETVRALGGAMAAANVHCEIAAAKFLSVVRPGDELRLEHERGADGSIHFTIRAHDRAVASGRLAWVTGSGDANREP
jgi:3-hydroxymyristoyl/3-hydroxydecanoyl-(acyl carrier protein) dehydratase